MMGAQASGEMGVDLVLPSRRSGGPGPEVHLMFFTSSGHGWTLEGNRVWTVEGVRLSAAEKRLAIRLARAALPRLTWSGGTSNG